MIFIFQIHQLWQIGLFLILGQMENRFIKISYISTSISPIDFFLLNGHPSPKKQQLISNLLHL